ncbi:MAG: hypothetical protein ACXIUL_02715 [Wenzhouxiangella sp.]
MFRPLAVLLMLLSASCGSAFSEPAVSDREQLLSYLDQVQKSLLAKSASSVCSHADISSLPEVVSATVLALSGDEIVDWFENPENSEVVILGRNNDVLVSIYVVVKEGGCQSFSAFHVVN